MCATITGTTGGNFEKLAVNPAAATTAITDTIDTSTVVLSSATAGANITEGGSIVYTATVGSAVTGSDLTVTLSNGDTITILVGDTIGSTVSAVRADNPYVNANGSLSVTIAGTSGGNYESLAASGTVINTVVDDADTTTVSLSANASVAEGGTITYTASLTNPAGTAMTVTLSNGATINIAANASSGSTTVAAPGEDVYVDAGSVSATITGTTGGNFENLAVNPAAATTAITDTIDTSTVVLSSATAGANITEGGSIVYTATVGSAVTGSDLTVTLSNGDTITILVGDTIGSTVSAVRADNPYVNAW